MPEQVSAGSAARAAAPGKARELLALLPHPAVLWSPGRDSGILNAPARGLFGFAGAEISGATWLECVHSQERNDYRRLVEQVLGGGGPARIDYRFVPPSRSEPVAVTEMLSVGDSANGELGESWSVFAPAAPTPAELPEGKRLCELLLGLNHEVSNNLQAIKGEVALLKIAGKISEQTCNTVNSSLASIRKLLLEMGEYLSPSPLHLNLENPATVFAEVLRESEKELAEHQIRIAFVMQEPLPAIPVGRQFRNALREVIQFSCALLPAGGEVKIETGLISTERGREMEIRVVNASATELGIDEVDVFRPFLKVNGRRIGLSMTVAREILRRHSGKIVFCREQRNRAVFSIRLRMPPVGEGPVSPTEAQGSKRRASWDKF